MYIIFADLENFLMKPGPSPFIIILSIYSMKTGGPYMILKSRMLPLTRTDLLYGGNIGIFFKVWL